MKPEESKEYLIRKARHLNRVIINSIEWFKEQNALTSEERANLQITTGNLIFILENFIETKFKQ